MVPFFRTRFPCSISDAPTVYATAVRLRQQCVVKAGHQTAGVDKGYDVANFVDPCRELGITPHVAAKAKGSRIDGRTTHQPGYEISQRKRKRVEEPFGWMKTFGLLRKLRHRGRETVDWQFRFTATAYIQLESIGGYFSK